MARSAIVTARALSQTTTQPAPPAPHRLARVGYIHPGKINLVAQVRPDDEYTDIDLLADSIAELGMIESPLVAELTPAEAIAYLAFFGRAFDVSLDVSDLVIDQATGRYLIVICGHRRTLAMRSLFARGCRSCQTEGGQFSAKLCRTRHLQRYGLSEGMEAKLRINPDPDWAYEIQMAENTKVDVSRDAETRRLRTGWETAKRLNPKLTKAEYARGKNRRPETITDALAYCDLPEAVRQSVRLGTTSYTVAVELSRLQRFGCDEATINFSMQKIRTDGLTAKQASRYVSGVLAARASTGPADLELFCADPASSRRQVIVRGVEEAAIRTFATEAASLAAITRAVENGLLPRTSPQKSPRVRAIVDRGDAARQQLALL